MNTPIIPEFGFILNRGNDLTEFFWPILDFVKKQILTNHTLPLWNNLFLAGTPLVSDPQAPIFYPVNLLALIMPLNVFFIISFAIHIILGALGAYLAAENGLRFSKTTSIFLALFYSLIPKFFAQIGAGHVGLVYATAWIPFAILAALKLREAPNIKNCIFLAVTLSLIYFSHLPIFLIISLLTGFLALSKRSAPFLLAAVIFVFGLTAVSLLPQIAWQKESTRYLLLTDHDVYPKWRSVKEVILAIFNTNPETEKAITLGFSPILLAIIGFLETDKRQKVILGVVLTASFLVILNNVSPIYPLLLKQNWYLLLRVATRFWILITLISLYLIGRALERHKSKLITLIAILAGLELAFHGASYIAKPIDLNPRLAPKEVYEYLARDKSLFRVYCLDFCLSQKETEAYNLELVGGYSTLQQKNFYKHSWQLTGTYWNYYTLFIPPLGADTGHPDIKSLGEYNVKYIISTSPLTAKGLSLKQNIKGFLTYENLLSVPRNYEIYTPNFIRVKIDSSKHQLVIPEVASPGWIAYLNGSEKVNVQETPNALRAVDIKPDTKFVDFYYRPQSFKYGGAITVATIVITTLIFACDILKFGKRGFLLFGRMP